MTVRNDYELIKTIFVNASEKVTNVAEIQRIKIRLLVMKKVCVKELKMKEGKSKCAIINININPADTFEKEID